MLRVVLAVLASGCATAPGSPPVSFALPSDCLGGSVEDEDAVQLLVLSRIASEWQAKQPWRLDRLSNTDSMVAKPEVAWLRRAFPEVHPGVAEAFAERNNSREPLQPHWPAHCPIELRNVWDRSQRSAPAPGQLIKHVFQVSRVGFDESHTQALVYVEYFCGGLCGSGTIYLVERRGGVWTIIRHGPSWIA
jgi:hypothetical protein